MASNSSGTGKSARVVSNIYFETMRFAGIEWRKRMGRLVLEIPSGSAAGQEPMGPDWRPGVWKEFIHPDPMLDSAEQYLQLAKRYGPLQRYGTSDMLTVDVEDGNLTFGPTYNQFTSSDDFAYWKKELDLLRLAFEIGELIYSDDQSNELKNFKEVYFDFDHILLPGHDPFSESLTYADEVASRPPDYSEPIFNNDPMRWLPASVQGYFGDRVHQEKTDLTIPTARRRLCYLLQRMTISDFREILRIIFNEKTQDVRLESIIHPVTQQIEFRVCPRNLLSLLWVQMAQEHKHKAGLQRCDACGQLLLEGRSDRRTCGARCRKNLSRMRKTSELSSRP